MSETISYTAFKAVYFCSGPLHPINIWRTLRMPSASLQTQNETKLVKFTKAMIFLITMQIGCGGGSVGWGVGKRSGYKFKKLH